MNPTPDTPPDDPGHARAGAALFQGYFKNLKSRWQTLSLQDLLSGHTHSVDFRGSRAHYIQQRIRPLALILAILMPLWTPIDYAILPDKYFPELVWLRFGCGLSFLLLALWDHHPYSLPIARLRLALLILIPEAFYLGVRFLLGDEVSSGLLIGYTFFPFMLVAVLSIFPLTLNEGFLLALPVPVASVGWYWLHGKLWSYEALNELWLLTLLMTIALWAELAQLHMLLRLYRQATRDALTGLVNRRVLVDGLRAHRGKNHRNHHPPISVILMDLDRFKRINDNYGHLVGDMALEAFARMLEAQCRPTDLIGRFGGEEFLAVLPDTDIEETARLAEKICTACRELSVPDTGGEPITFTTSVGIAELQPNESISTFLNRVDEALYAAKGGGRDCVVQAVR